MSKAKAAGTVEFTPAAFLLHVKATKANHIVKGDDTASLQFISEEIGVPERVSKVTDDMLVGQSGHVYHITEAYCVDLSPEMRSKVGFWSADPITRGSSALHAIVKHAASLMGISKLSRNDIDIVGDQIIYGMKNVVCIRAALAEAMWILTSEIKADTPWTDPWKQPTAWMNPDTMIVAKRLHVLYHRLVSYATWLGKGDAGVKGLNVSPHEIQRYKDMVLDPTKVYNTLQTLSQWRMGRWTDLACAGIISSIWI